MECRFNNQIEPYCDDELSANDRHSFEQHLKACSSCKASVDEIHSIATLIQNANDTIPVRDDWLQSVSREIHVHTVLRPSDSGVRYGKLAVGMAALAAILLIVLGINFYQPTRNSPPTDMQVSTNNDSVDSQSQIVGSAPIAIPQPTVTAHDGFLAARDPRSDESFEFYWVLPQQTNF
jgi:predicted anti-sigma-YlaC factor YlaD